MTNGFNFQYEEIEEWLRLLPDLIKSPKKFYRVKAQQKKGVLIKEIIFWILINAGVGLLLLFNSTLHDVTNRILNILAVITPLALFIGASIFIKTGKVRLKYILITSVFPVLILGIFETIAYGLFLSTENYTYKAISSFLFLTIVLMATIHMILVNSRTRKEFLMIYLLFFLSTNIARGLHVYFQFDTFDKLTFKYDPIMKEYSDVFNGIDSINLIPFKYRVTTWDNGSPIAPPIVFVKNGLHDTGVFTSSNKEVELYRFRLNRTISYLLESDNSIKYERNSEIISELLMAYQEMRKELSEADSNLLNDNCLDKVEQTMYISKKDTIAITQFSYLSRYSYATYLRDASKHHNEMMDAYEASTAATVIGRLIYYIPSLIIVDNWLIPIQEGWREDKSGNWTKRETLDYEFKDFP